MEAEKTYIALLRGINVGGHRKLKMADLRTIISDMGFENVQTYIQSGNVVFEASEIDTDELSRKIKLQVETTFGYEVPVIIRTAAVLKSILANMPSRKKRDGNDTLRSCPVNPKKNNRKNWRRNQIASNSFTSGTG